MNKPANVKSNFLYQVLYNLVTMVIPLVVTPFLTRALLETELGRFTYSRSVASYFVVFAMMGIAKYGQRVISQNADSEESLRTSFWSLFYTHIAFSVISLCAYICMVLLFIKTDTALFWIQTVYVVSALFDITWLFYGLENFKGVVIRNAVIKVIEAVLYIALIKTPADISLYAVINCSAFVLSQIVLLPGAIKSIRPIRVSRQECLVHVKPLMVFAVAVIGITLYTIFDTTLLGLFSTKENVAFYEYSNRIVKIPLAAASVIGTVMFPRACKLASQNRVSEQTQYMKLSMMIVSLIGSASFWGLLLVATPLASIYLGDGFGGCGQYIIALSPLIIIVGIGDVVRTQYMIPNGMDKEYIISILLNAVTNLLISTVLILLLPPVYQIYGAILGTVAAESVGMIYQLILCRKVVPLRHLMKTTAASVVLGVIMYFPLRLVTRNIPWTLWSLVGTVAGGAVIFVVCTVIYLRLFEKNMWTQLRQKEG